MESATAAPPNPPPAAPRHRGGDRFEDFYRANYAPLVRLSYSLSGSVPVAEELAQEAFIEAHRRWNRIRSFDRPDLWVRRVVINRSISHLRRSQAERRAIQRVRNQRVESTEIVLEDDDVWAALRTLPDRQAQVMALVYVEDRAIADVARILGVGEETVRTHLKRGRASMAKRLDPAGEEVER